jgi:hypothetical protein
MLTLDGQVMELRFNTKITDWDWMPLEQSYTLLFSTTYFDRNQKEIYEGDFVKDVIGGDYYLIQFCPTEGFYGVRLPDFSKKVGINYLDQRVIVAGNIKENYEEFTSLLKPGVDNE